MMQILFSAKFSTSKHTYHSYIDFPRLTPDRVEEGKEQIIKIVKSELIKCCGKWGVESMDLIKLEIYYNDILREIGDSEVEILKWEKNEPKIQIS